MVTQTPPRLRIFRRMPIEAALQKPFGGRHRLSQVYRTRDLVVLGIGVMIGAGIFKIAGVQAATSAGPGVILSFVIAGVVCLLACLSYAELSSTMPLAGSAYSFTYVIFGEVWAWVIGCALICEMVLGAGVVSRAWSLYAAQSLSDAGITVPSALAGVIGQPKGFDLAALIILLTVVAVVAVGSRLGVRLVWFFVAAKVLVIAAVIGIGALHIHLANYKPLTPAPEPQATGGGGRTMLQTLMGGTPHTFGTTGIFVSAAIIVFAYLGFDMIATAAEETRDAPRNVPRGMVIGLMITTVLYLCVAVVMVGMVHYDRLDQGTPLTHAFKGIGADWMVPVIDVGALLGLTTVILVLMVAQTRVVFSMARDGLLPKSLSMISRRYRVPSRSTLACGAVGVLLSQTVDVLTLEEVMVMGGLFAFLFVSAGVIMLRGTRPDLPRGFQVPLSPLTPIVAIAGTIWTMLNLTVDTWKYFEIFMIAGLLVYLVYGRRNSVLAETLRPSGRPANARAARG